MARRRGSGASLVLLRLGDLRPYLLLAVLTVLILTAAYAARPVVAIDLGSDYDFTFLSDFNGREIDAAGPSASFAWPAGQEALTLPGGRQGVLVAVLEAAPGLPADALRQAAVAVNGIRVDMPRRPPGAIVVAVPPDIADDPQLTFTLVSPLVGDPPPPPDLVASVSLAPARTYRWSSSESQLILPNLGRGAWTVALSVVTAHPDGAPLDARVYAGDTLLTTLPENADQRRISLLVPPELVRDGTLRLTLRANTFDDPRPLGLLLSDVTVAPAGPSGLRTALPPLGGLGLALVTILGAYTSLALIVGSGSGRQRVPAYVWATLAMALVACLGGWMLSTYRFPSSFMLPRLAWLAVWSVLLVIGARALTIWLFRAAGVADGPEIQHSAFLSLLLLIFLVGYWLKAVGMVFPYFTAIDVQWHMERARWVLDGRLPLLYGINSPLNETTMPTAEWGANRPVIPYSPWYHMVASLFSFSPMTMPMTANMVSLLLDSSRVILIALLTLKAGLSRRGALIAAATYATLPVTFLLHSWGNVPTTFGLWLTLLAGTIIFAFWERLHERPVLIALSVIFLITFLIYTVTGVFMGVFLVVLTALVWLNGLRGGPWRALRGQLRPLWTAAGVAIALALVIYYGQYIPPIIERTIPYMSTVFTQGPQSVGVERPPFGAYMLGFIPHLGYWIIPGDYLFYGIGVPMLFTIPGFIALRRRPLAWVICATWLSVAVLFMLAGYRISMVDKQIFYMLPIMCVCWAVCADWAWARWAWARWLVLAVLAFSLYAALDQWLLRIVTSPVAG